MRLQQIYFWGRESNKSKSRPSDPLTLISKVECITCGSKLFKMGGKLFVFYWWVVRGMQTRKISAFYFCNSNVVQVEVQIEKFWMNVWQQNIVFLFSLFILYCMQPIKNFQKVKLFKWFWLPTANKRPENQF